MTLSRQKFHFGRMPFVKRTRLAWCVLLGRSVTLVGVREGAATVEADGVVRGI